MENRLEFNSMIKETENNSLSLFYCGLEKCLPDHDFGPAIRTHYLIHYIISGEGTFYCQNKSYNLKANDAFLIIPGKSTYYKASTLNPWEYCWIGLGGYEALTLLQNCGFSEDVPIIHISPNNPFKQSLLNLITNFESKNINNLSLTGYLYLCLSHIYNHTPPKEFKESKTYFNKAINYIHNNFSYDIQVTDISNFIGIDRTYLYKIFIKYSNKSPQQYLISYRLDIASNLLTSSKISITEIAFSCGFKDIPAFYTHFKKKFKTTPSKFRKNFFILYDK